MAIMEIQTTEHFHRQYRKMRTLTRSQVRNSLIRLRNEAENNPNWLTQVKRMQNTAVSKCFRFKVTSGDRLIAAQYPPLRFLDIGPHDVYDNWTLGKTHKSIQLKRAEKLVENPSWLEEIFGS